MPRILLTDMAIRQLAVPAKGQVTYWDTTLPTFGLRVSQGGSRTFLLMKSNRRHTIGKYGTLTLQQARKRARELLAQATLGKLEPTALAFSFVCKQFLDNRKQDTRPTTYKSLERLLSVHFSHFDNKPLNQITPEDISNALTTLADTPSEANHAYAAAKQLFRYAVRRRYVKFDPVSALERPAPIGKRSHVPTDEEVCAILATDFPAPYGPFTRLLFLTGIRRNSLVHLHRGHINTKDQVFDIPAHLCKNNTPYTAPYGSLTAVVLKALPPTGLLFPSRYDTEKPFSGFSKYKTQFDELSKVTGYTLHDARRYFSSTHARLGTPLNITELLLHHTSGQLSGVASIYNRYSYLAELRAAVARYDVHLRSLLPTDDRH